MPSSPSGNSPWEIGNAGSDEIGPSISAGAAPLRTSNRAMCRALSPVALNRVAADGALAMLLSSIPPNVTVRSLSGSVAVAPSFTSFSGHSYTRVFPALSQ